MQVFDAKFRGSFPNLTRWFVTCMNHPEFAAILGEVALCEKAKEAVAPKGAKKDKASCDPAPAFILAALPRASQPGVVVFSFAPDGHLRGGGECYSSVALRARVRRRDNLTPARARVRRAA